MCARDTGRASNEKYGAQCNYRNEVHIAMVTEMKHTTSIIHSEIKRKRRRGRKSRRRRKRMRTRGRKSPKSYNSGEQMIIAS